MNNIFKSVVAMAIAILLSFNVMAQEEKEKTCEFEVKGVCMMCKDRIENAAYIKGVKFVNWNQETGMLKVVYKPSKISQKDIEQSVADAGHATENKAATPAAYEKLPHCCKYADGISKH